MKNMQGESSMEDRILIVDDEEVICSILARRLTGEGYSCATADKVRESNSIPIFWRFF